MWECSKSVTLEQNGCAEANKSGNREGAGKGHGQSSFRRGFLLSLISTVAMEGISWLVKVSYVSAPKYKA